MPVLGDRRTFYEAETDLWTLVSRIAAGRKARELDPAAIALRQCVDLARNDKKFGPVVERPLFGAFAAFLVIGFQIPQARPGIAPRSERHAQL